MHLIITFSLTFEVESKKKTRELTLGFGFDSVEGTRVEEQEEKNTNGSGYLRKRESMPGQ